MSQASSITALMTFGFSPNLANLFVNGNPETLDLTLGDIVIDAITAPSAATASEFIISGGTSTTSGSAGGTLTMRGGTPGATGSGGTAQVLGGTGGSTSGGGGVARLQAGAAGGGTSGGAAQVTGGASGSGATGIAGAVVITGGASLATNGTGGAVTITGGASTGTGSGQSVILASGAVSTGAAGGVFVRSTLYVPQGAPTTKTVSATLTAAEVLAGIITGNEGATGAAAYQLPTATDLDTAMASALAAGDAFDFSVINISTVAGEDITITTNAGWTLVGSMVVESFDSDRARSSGRFRARLTAANTFTLYRIA